MQKTYVSANELLLDSFTLAKQVKDSGYEPTALIVPWRGGMPVGICMHEYFHTQGVTLKSTVIKTSAYSGIDKRSDVTLAPFAPDFTEDDRLLIVDDVFDTGRTMKALKEELGRHCKDIRIATVFFKPSRNETELSPDYYLYATDEWIVFPHEVDGLTPEELEEKSPALARLFP
ncbi:hypothetical protein AUJ68_03725 [Candidatus Woesearchaeota archaeon CG1_02_57_44]|nr:MAG: hypothetical protein AUJ68_03725 [Candidatus Woesearchaeota archaeon CG1_02_57_44]